MQRYRGARCERDLIKQCKAAYIRRSERVFLRLGENVSPTVLGFRAVGRTFNLRLIAPDRNIPVESVESGARLSD